MGISVGMGSSSGRMGRGIGGIIRKGRGMVMGSSIMGKIKPQAGVYGKMVRSKVQVSI